MVIKKHISTLESLNFHFLLDESLLEPYVSKGTRTVLRRGKESNFSPLSDVFQFQCKWDMESFIKYFNNFLPFCLLV